MNETTMTGNLTTRDFAVDGNGNVYVCGTKNGTKGAEFGEGELTVGKSFQNVIIDPLPIAFPLPTGYIAKL